MPSVTTFTKAVRISSLVINVPRRKEKGEKERGKGGREEKKD